MECLIISGMSGAGKSLAADVLEDIGYYCIDNMPVKLIPQFTELFGSLDGENKKAAFVVGVRGGGDYSYLFRTLEELSRAGNSCHVLFLDCADETLINRQKASRRRHPLDMDGRGLEAAIRQERELIHQEYVRLRTAHEELLVEHAELRMAHLSLKQQHENLKLSVRTQHPPEQG